MNRPDYTDLFGKETHIKSRPLPTRQELQTHLALTIDRVRIKQGAFYLNNITFTAQQGDILGLIGKSGAGKSTLLRAILGLQPYQNGVIALTREGRELILHEHIGYSPQDHALYPNLTLQENCEVFGGLNDMKKDAVHTRMQKLLSRLKLVGQEKKRVTQLSGGMRKRADLLVALLHNPEVLILDEPFTGLDISIRKFIWDLLQELSAQGKIILLTTHDITDVRDYCNNFGVLYENTFYGKQDVLASLHGDKTHLTEYVKHIFDQEKNT